MRCLVLAERLRDHDVEVFFVCRAHEGHMGAAISERGFEVVLLDRHREESDIPKQRSRPTAYDTWIGASWKEDATETLRTISQVQPMWTIVDHYGIDEKWEDHVVEAGGSKIMAIDGQANRRHQCHLLLDPSFSLQGPRRWDGLLSPDCIKLIGPGFALFRPEFYDAKSSASPRVLMAKPKKILITFGGTDANNLSVLAVQAVRQISKQREVEINLLIGNGNPNLESYRDIKYSDVKLYVQPNSVAKLMAESDLAITAGGGTLLELLYLNVPSIVVAIAENQLAMCNDLEKIGAIHYLGSYETLNRDEILDALHCALINLLDQPFRAKNMADKGATIFSGADDWLQEYLLS
jgi:UDP-2,4-diacetamido-2,4,6-trideoxy-beta-L-altropyranose hydrolase